jgi:hypothetical protein
MQQQERWLLKEHADHLSIAHAYPDTLAAAQVKAIVIPGDLQRDKCVICAEAIMLSEATFIVVDIRVKRGCRAWYKDSQGSEMPQRKVFEGLQRIYLIYFDPALAARRWPEFIGRLPTKVTLQGRWTLPRGMYRPLEVQEVEFRRARFNHTADAWDRHWRIIRNIDEIARPTAGMTVKMVSLEDVAYLLPPADKFMCLYKAIRESMGEPHARPH